jgi:hypothetical protein
MTTWLDAIDANRFDGWTHTMLLTEDQRTLFQPSPRPSIRSTGTPPVTG